MSDDAQLPLRLPTRARRGDPDTSHAAARSMEVGASIQDRAILGLLTHADRPLNYREMEDRLGWAPPTANRRLAGLRRAGFVERYDKTETPSGRLAWTYQATPLGSMFMADLEAREEQGECQ